MRIQPLAQVIQRITVVVALALAVGLLLPFTSRAQTPPRLRFMGFSPSVAPADSLPFRQALAWAIDREEVARAAAAAGTPARAAPSLQHPSAPGYNPSVRGYTYDPIKARELYKQSGWTGPVVIQTSAPSNRFLEALRRAIEDGLRKALEVQVTLQPAADFNALARATTAGTAAIYTYGWVSAPSDFGYPSMPLGLARNLVRDPEVGALVEKRDAATVEQMLLDKALIVPIIFY